MSGTIRTLKELRRNAPRQDRNDPALALPDKSQWVPRPGSRYHPASLYPRTLDELRQRAGAKAGAAVSELIWDAVGVWLMKSYPDRKRLKHDYADASDAVRMIREEDRYRLGWPRHDGKQPATPALHGLTADRRREVKAIAEDTRAAWEVAGCPYADADRITRTYQNLMAGLAATHNNTRPDTPDITTKEIE